MNIILVSIDSLRRDRLGAYDEKHAGLAPHINSLASNGAVFKNHYTVSNGSNPSHCSILTGAYPVKHGVHQNGWKLSKTIPTLAAELQKRGYYTVGAVSLETLSSMYGLNRGFDKYFDNSKHDGMMKFARKVGYKRYTVAKALQHLRIFDTHSRSYKDTNKEVLGWLDENSHKKFFFFVHYFDLHRDTYGREKKQHGSKYKEAHYNRNVEVSNTAIQELVDKLKEKGIFEKTMIVILSDHGETIMDKYPKVAHGWDICQQEFNTPLIFHYPPLIKAQEVSHLSRTIDVAPTILEFADCDVPKSLDGKSFKKVLDGEESETPTIAILENYAGFKNIKAIKKDHWFYILRDDSIEELYNDSEDYNLDHNIISQHSDVAQRFRATLDEYYKNRKADQETDEHTKEMLRKLGYLD
jgi:arylsulfatase A-like enzyme